MAFHWPRRFAGVADAPAGRATRQSEAFTLVELLVGAILIALVSTSTAILMNSSNRSIVGSTSRSAASAGVDSDISRIQRLSERYTCCSGVCSADPAVIAAAVAAGQCAGVVGDSSYYWPQLSAGVTTFTTICSNGTLTDNLITAINAQNLAQAAGVARVVGDDDSADNTDHRIRLSYTGNGINRVLKVTPTAARWCP